jgi:hypothetical protein
MCCFFKLNLRSRTIWVTDLLERGKSEVEKKERKRIHTFKRSCMDNGWKSMCVYMYTHAGNLISPLLLFSFLSSLSLQYVCICVPTSMINHIVLYTQWNLAIISDGGDVNHIEIKKTASYIHDFLRIFHDGWTVVDVLSFFSIFN